MKGLRSTPEVLKTKIKVFERRIRELQKRKKLMPLSDKRKTKKEIRHLEWCLIVSGHYVRDFEFLLNEADRVAQEIITKRNTPQG